MSLEAMLWALKEAPDVPAHCLGVLIGLAEHADKHGFGAYPSTATLAVMARKSERQAQYDLDKLADLKLIRLGDQALAARLPGNRRPVVYDLAIEWTRSSGVQPIAPQAGVQPIAGQQSTSPQQPIAPQDPADLRKQSGVQSASPQQGCNPLRPGVQPTAPKPSVKPKASPSEKPNSGGAGGTLFGDDPAKPAAGAAKSRSRKPRDPKPEHPRFGEWYEAFPLHKARAEASDAYHKAVDAGADPEALLAAAIGYHRDDKVIRGFSKYPATWLNKQCWLDEPAPQPQDDPADRRNGAGRQANYADEEYRSGW